VSSVARFTELPFVRSEINVQEHNAAPVAGLSRVLCEDPFTSEEPARATPWAACAAGAVYPR
jgi:hypothetical protein